MAVLGGRRDMYILRGFDLRERRRRGPRGGLYGNSWVVSHLCMGPARLLVTERVSGPFRWFFVSCFFPF